jgi:hypothetical protein
MKQKSIIDTPRVFIAHITKRNLDSCETDSSSVVEPLPQKACLFLANILGISR